MTQKHLFKKSFVCLLLLALIFVLGCGGSSQDPPLTTEVIDLSHSGGEDLGFGFGDGPGTTLEAKRWQTFTATSNRVVTAVEVKIRKIGSGTYTPILVELYETTADGKPTGQPLAHGLINPDWTNNTTFTVVKTGLNYEGLVAGKHYAIVLTQGLLTNAHYEWCTRPVSPDLHFGKYVVGSGWTDESNLGDGWLKVYVASKSTPPTRIYIYPAAPPPISKNDGNLRGSYPDARTGADFIAAYRPLSLAGKTSHAFISISSTDSIANMPSKFGFPNNIPIVKVTDDTIIVADNWSDLLDGSIKISLSDAFGWTGNYGWWSGSNTNGTYDASSENCGGWTDINKNGRTGETNSTDAIWIHSVDGVGNGPRYILGIAY